MMFLRRFTDYNKCPTTVQEANGVEGYKYLGTRDTWELCTFIQLAVNLKLF